MHDETFRVGLLDIPRSFLLFILLPIDGGVCCLFLHDCCCSQILRSSNKMFFVRFLLSTVFQGEIEASMRPEGEDLLRRRWQFFAINVFSVISVKLSAGWWIAYAAEKIPYIKLSPIPTQIFIIVTCPSKLLIRANFTRYATNIRFKTSHHLYKRFFFSIYLQRNFFFVGDKKREKNVYYMSAKRDRPKPEIENSNVLKFNFFFGRY